MTPDKDEQFVARFYGVSLGTVRRWRYSGTGPKWFKLNALCRYRLADLHVFLESLPGGGTGAGSIEHPEVHT